MKLPISLSICAISGIFLTACLPLRAQDDAVMKAMRDEMDRSMKQLKLEKLDQPYFISFRVVEHETTTVTASFGALQNSSRDRGRMLLVEVRVGDHQLDNTNFASMNFNPSMAPGANGSGLLPVEDDYRELRRQMWLVTDAVYKKALEDISKKRAMLQNQNNTDETPDFTKEAPAKTAVDGKTVQADRPGWEALARRLSGLFREMPAVYTSNVTLFASNRYVRYLNSDGTMYTEREPTVTFNAYAATQASDGSPLDDFVWRHARSLEGLPRETELTANIRALGERLTNLRAAATIENYNGPVLAEGEAAPQLFRLVFVPNLLGSHRVLMDNQYGRQNMPAENPFIDKIDARVLPGFLSITDNPLITEYQKIPLAGATKVDEDGIPTRETLLVEKGILKTLLVTRDPVRGINHSTGSRHSGGTAPTNVIVAVDNGLTAAEMKAKFLELVAQRHKEYGIVVRRMRSATSPVLAYKVFPDGREELIHSIQFAGLNAANFKEIVAASKDLNTLTVDFRPPNAPGMGMAMNGGGRQFTPVTLVAPSILFEDVTLRKVRGETPKPPVAPHPFFDSTK